MSLFSSRLLAATILSFSLTACSTVSSHSSADNEGDRPPEVISRPVPLYPYELRVRNITGIVTFNFTIEKDGSVEEVDVIESTDPLFSQEAIAAVKKWKFRPALGKGKPIRKQLHTSLSFNIPN